jgi:hypothetical protein
VSAPLQAFVFSSYLLNVLLQLANKNGIQNKQKKRFIIGHTNWMSRGSVVGVATAYGLDDREVGVRFPVGSRIFASPYRLDRL